MINVVDDTLCSYNEKIIIPKSSTRLFGYKSLYSPEERPESKLAIRVQLNTLTERSPYKRSVKNLWIFLGVVAMNLVLF